MMMSGDHVIMNDKPIKWGIKVFVLSDAANGYVYHFQIYAGKGMNCTMEVGVEGEGFDLFTGDYFTIPQPDFCNKGAN